MIDITPELVQRLVKRENILQRKKTALRKTVQLPVPKRSGIETFRKVWVLSRFLALRHASLRCQRET